MVSGPTDCELCPVRAHGICEHLSDPVLDALGAIAVESAVKKGSVLAIAGGEANAMFVVKDGELKAVRTLSDGRHQIVGFVASGDIIGGPYAEETYDCTFEALTDAVICKIPRRKLELVSERHPALVRALLNATFAELRRRNSQAVMLGRKSADERVASFLLERRCSHEETDGDGKTHCRAVLSMSRAEIADYLGLTIETVSRTLSHFRQDGMVEVSQYKKIDMLDAARLKCLAGDDFTDPDEDRVFM